MSEDLARDLGEAVALLRIVNENITIGQRAHATLRRLVILVTAIFVGTTVSGGFIVAELHRQADNLCSGLNDLRGSVLDVTLPLLGEPEPPGPEATQEEKDDYNSGLRLISEFKSRLQERFEQDDC